ncbi:hypothetical protein EDD64_12155 [Effusibacillus lacus]|nr:hypothetical protein EDD64_12155 [Effusibacillus lacus]
MCLCPCYLRVPLCASCDRAKKLPLGWPAGSLQSRVLPTVLLPERFMDIRDTSICSFGDACAFSPVTLIRMYKVSKIDTIYFSILIISHGVIP